MASAVGRPLVDRRVGGAELGRARLEGLRGERAPVGMGEAARQRRQRIGDLASPMPDADDDRPAPPDPLGR